MIEVTPELTRRIAELARLELSQAEVATFTEQLGKILAHVEALSEVPVEGVEPLLHPVASGTRWREDEARPSPRDPEGHPRMLASAPETEDGGYRVPPVL